MKSFVISAVIATTLGFAGTATAQTAPAAPQITHGAPIPGVCVYHLERLLAQSTAGQSVRTGMQRLQQEVQAELAPYQTTIQQEDQALAQGAASLPVEERQRRTQALQQRFEEFQQLGQTRSRELEYTQALQRDAIIRATDPIILIIYQQRGCSILLDRTSAYVTNPAMEITDAVIQQLNTALPSLSFNRSPVPVQVQPQQ